MDREALTPFRCKTSSSLLSNNILRPETAAAVPVGLLFLSVTATRCFILALFSRGWGGFHRKALHSACCSPPSGTVLPRAARRVRSRGEQSCCGRQWLKWPRAAPSPSSSCHRTRDLSLFPRLSLLILYGQTSLFSPSVVGSSSGRLFAFNSRQYSTTCWLCSLQTPAPAVCDSQVWKLCQRACICAVQTGALSSALT